jgi:hypothetical protein
MTEQQITQAREDLEQLGIEQLRCGVMIQLLKIEALTKERDALQFRVNQQASMVEKCIEEMNRNADIGAQAGKERDAVAAAAKMALDALGAATTPLATDRQEVLRAIEALREAGMQ